MSRTEAQKSNSENFKLKSNLWKLKILQGIRFSLVAMPVIIIFFKVNGLNYFEIFLTQTSFSIAVFISELPCGYFADKFGRKLALVMGAIILPISVALFTFWHTFAGFMVAEFCIGIAFSLFSGNESALLYDSLKILKQEDDYKKQEGSVQCYGRSFEAVAAIIGGILAAFFIVLPLYVWFAVTLLAFPLAITLTEAKYTSQQKGNQTKTFDNIVNILKIALNKNKAACWTLIYSATINLITLTSVWLFQPYFLEQKVPFYLFGIGWALLNLSTAFFARQAAYIEKKLGGVFVFAILPITLCIATLFFFFFNSPIIFIFALIIQAVRGIKMPLAFGILNKKINSEIRASVLSIDGMLSRLFFIILAPFVGLYCDYVSLNSSFIILALIAISLGIISVIKMIQHKAFE
jgi:MFS family permease